MSLPRPFHYRYLRPPDLLDIFHAELLHESAEYLVLTHVVHPKKPMVHRGEEVLSDGSRIVWFLFNGKPYDVGRFYHPNGTWTGYYVDITEPVRWTGAAADTLETVTDLFLDLWIAPDGTHEVLDREELEMAFQRGYVSIQQVEGAERALHEVLDLLIRGCFPPSPVIQWHGNRSDIFDATATQ